MTGTKMLGCTKYINDFSVSEWSSLKQQLLYTFWCLPPFWTSSYSQLSTTSFLGGPGFLIWFSPWSNSKDGRGLSAVSSFWRSSLIVSDVLSTFNSIVGFIIVLLHRQRIVILRRIFLIGAIMYGMRAVVMSVVIFEQLAVISFNFRPSYRQVSTTARKYVWRSQIVQETTGCTQQKLLKGCLSIN